MCRLLAYMGQRPICLADLIKKPRNSLIAQSRSSQGERRRLNADGFGLGWYNLPMGPEPAIYRSTQPVWNDRNLHHFIEKTASQLFIAHIRASTIGVVSESNCHPFSYGKHMMAHNGTIKGFHSIKRAMLAQLPDPLFLSIQGTTDSESFFYLILSYLDKPEMTLTKAVIAALSWVESEQSKLDDEHYSRINLVMSDGEEIVAVKMATKGHPCHSLFLGREPRGSGFVVSSEIVGFARKNWLLIPDNSIVTLNKKHEDFEIQPYSKNHGPSGVLY